MAILPVGFVKWDGTKYIIVESIDLSGPAGPPGPQGPAGVAAGPASGDLGGNYPNPLVIKLQGRSISSSAPSDGQILTWVASNNDWEPQPAPTGFTAGGDLSGTSTNQNVINIHGASVPIAGALTTGNVLQVTGASALSYAAVNLAGGSNFVTGTLPAGNQASQTLSGDVTGTTASNTVVTLTGSTGIVTFPISNILRSSGGSNVGDIITTAAGVITFGNTTSSTTTRMHGASAITLTVSSSGGNIQLQCNGGGAAAIYQDANNIHFRDSAGNAYFSFDFNSPSLKCDSGTGTFPAFGLIRFKEASSNLAAWHYSGTDYGLLSVLSAGLNIGAKADGTNPASTVALNAATAIGFVFSNATHWYMTPGDFTLQAYKNDAAPTIKQRDLTTNSGTGNTFTIQAQNETGTTSIGGNLVLASGSGTSTNGSVLLNSGATTNVTVSPTSADFAVPIRLATSGTYATFGDIRSKDARDILSANYSSTDYGLLSWSASTFFVGTDLAGTHRPVSLSLNAGNFAFVSIGGGNQVLFSTGSLAIAGALNYATPSYIFDFSYTAKFHFGVDATSAAITYDDITTNSATGNTLTIKGQNATGTTSVGGNLNLASGSGTSTDGYIGFYPGGYEFARMSHTAAAGGYLTLDSSSGTFPTTGFIRTKTYGSSQVLWNGYLSSNAPIISQNGSTLIFGDEATWTPTSLRGFSLQYYAATGTHAWLGSSSATIMALANAELTLGDTAATPTIKQGDLTTNSGTGHTFTIQAQNETGTTSVGGNLNLASGSGTSTDGYIGFYPGGYEFARMNHNVATGGWLQLDSSSGTFPASGLIRFKRYVGTTTLIASNSTAGDHPILTINNGTLNFGSSDATFGTTNNFFAYNGQISTRTVLGIYTQTSGGLTFGDFGTANANIIMDFGAAAGTCNVRFGTSITPTIKQDDASSASGVALTIQAQNGFGTGVTNGGDIILRGGARNSTGLKGGVKIQMNNTTETMFEVVSVLDGYRVTAFNRGSNLTATEMPLDTGDLVTYIGNAAMIPTVSPVSGGILYSNAGALEWYSPGGTQTTVAPNDPHCPKCGRDWVLSARNNREGWRGALCLFCLGTTLAKLGVDVSEFSFDQDTNK